MDNIKNLQLYDEALDEVAGGNAIFENSVTAQTNTNTVHILTPILLHPDSRADEYKNTNVIPDSSGRF